MNRKGNVLLYVFLGVAALLCLIVVVFYRPEAWYVKTATITDAQQKGVWPRSYTASLGGAHAGWYKVGFCSEHGVIEQPSSYGVGYSLAEQDNVYIFKYLGVFDPQWCVGDSLLSEVSS